MNRLAVSLSALLVTVLTGGPANGEVITRVDPDPSCSQRPALNVKRATFNYAPDRFVWRIKMGALSKRHSRVIARYTLGTRAETRFDVMLQTKFDANGDKRVFGHWSNYTTDEYGIRFTDGVGAKWDWERNVIKFTLTSHVRGRRADAWAYSVAKGQMHGPPCGDYIWSGRISRG